MTEKSQYNAISYCFTSLFVDLNYGLIEIDNSLYYTNWHQSGDYQTDGKDIHPFSFP